MPSNCFHSITLICRLTTPTRKPPLPNNLILAISSHASRCFFDGSSTSDAKTMLKKVRNWL